MSFIDIILLAVALAMDCFTVSIVSGLTSQDSKLHEPWLYRMAFLFGCFQAFMPLLGWLGIIHFQTYIEAYDHWIAFGLLAFIGGKMIWESFGDDEEQHFNPRRLHTQLLLAIATSIDALAVGFSFSMLDVRIWIAVLIIGFGSFLFSVGGFYMGKFLSQRIKPTYAEILGGLILIGIGIKILIEHSNYSIHF